MSRRVTHHAEVKVKEEPNEKEEYGEEPVETRAMSSPSGAGVSSGDRAPGDVQSENVALGDREEGKDDPVGAEVEVGGDAEFDTCFKIDKVYSVTENNEDQKLTDNASNKKETEKTKSTAKLTIITETNSNQELKDAKLKDERAIKPRISRSGVAKIPSLAGVGGVRVLGGGLRGSNVPLIVSMGAGNPGIPLLPAGLPPGRYVILPGTSTTNTTKTSQSAAVTTTTTTLKPRLATSIAPSVSKSFVTAAAAVAAAASAQKGPTVAQTIVTPASQMVHGRMYSRERGRRKSYTAGEKLAMIEAVEAGQRKSAVADKFGVAPSTLACILAQKHKIRAEQDNLTRRRVRHTKYHLRHERKVARLAPALTLSTPQDTPFTHFLAPLTQPQPLDAPATPMTDVPSTSLMDTQPEQIIAMPDLETEGQSDPDDSRTSTASETPVECDLALDATPQERVTKGPRTGQRADVVGDENQSQETEQQDSSAQETQGLTGPYLLKKETHCTTVLDQLLRDETYTDVTLTAQGQSLRAHRIVLCLASPYFRQVLSRDMNVQSVILLRDVKFAELRNIIHFIYTGEATVDASELESFMRTAEMLEITALCESQRCIAAQSGADGVSTGFTIGDFEKLVGTKRPRKENTPQPTKTRKLSGGSPSSKPASTSAVPDIPLGIIKYECESPEPSPLLTHDDKVECKVEPLEIEEDKSPKRERRDSSSSIGGFAAIAGLQKDLQAADQPTDIFLSSSENPTSSRQEEAIPALNECDTTAIPGRCPYCPHLPQRHEGMGMMRHLLVAHPCKPAFPCDQCWRVFVKRSAFKSHRSKCQDSAFHHTLDC